MRWSWPIGRLAGIPLRVHVTFPLLVAWIAAMQWRRDGDVAGVASLVLLILLVFAIVVLHELGHALAGRRYGVATRDITLLPIGGIARLERIPKEPKQELVIALAGPAVNVAIAALLAAVLAAMGGVGSFTDVTALAQADPSFDLRLLGLRLVAINIWLVVFNSPLLVLIAVFVWLAGTGEGVAVRTQAALEGTSLRAMMITDLRTVAPHDPLSHAAQLVIDGFQQDFPVVDDARYVGMLSRADLVRGLSLHGRDGAVRQVMRAEGSVVDVNASPESALALLTGSRGAALPVLERERLVGLLTSENLMEFLMLRDAVRGGR